MSNPQAPFTVSKYALTLCTQGTILDEARITFAVLPESTMQELGAYFRPPLDRQQIAASAIERVASLYFYGVPDPRFLAEAERVLSTSTDLRERVRANLVGAAAFDNRLDKARAHEFLRAAIELDPQMSDPDEVKIARRIAQGHLSVYRAQTLAFLDELEASFPRSPVVKIMRSSVDEAQPREDERRARYLFPDH